MTNDADLMPDLGQEDAFEVQMRGYSRRQVDEFVARARSQIRSLEERLSRAVDDTERARLELSTARQDLSNKPAHEEVSVSRVRTPSCSIFSACTSSLRNISLRRPR